MIAEIRGWSVITIYCRKGIITFHFALTTWGLRWLRTIFRWMFLSSLTAPGLSTPASSAELPSEQSAILPFCPLKALSAWATPSILHLPPFISIHFEHSGQLFVCPSPPALTISIQYIYLATCFSLSLSHTVCLSLSLWAMWAGDPLSPLYPSLPSTWPRADYILDITVPDVYD